LTLNLVRVQPILLSKISAARPATEITFEVEDNVPWSHGSVQEIEAVRAGISYLPGGRTLKFWVGYPNWNEIIPGKSLLKVKISYFAEAITNKREIMIDLAQFIGTSDEISPEERIANAISRLADSQRIDRMYTRFMPKMKACTECAENIKFAAKRCHFCGADQPLNTEENVSFTESN
jgi:hypothetical protein